MILEPHGRALVTSEVWVQALDVHALEFEVEPVAFLGQDRHAAMRLALTSHDSRCVVDDIEAVKDHGLYGSETRTSAINGEELIALTSHLNSVEAELFVGPRILAFDDHDFAACSPDPVGSICLAVDELSFVSIGDVGVANCTLTLAR